MIRAVVVGARSVAGRAFGTDGSMTTTRGRAQVTTDPYPGYVHGRRPAVCPLGCEPTRERDLDESAESRLRREAEEYARLYGKEKGLDETRVELRIAEIMASIDATGTYEHTIDEIRHGARVAWRNAPKCINRKFWATLDIIDARHAATNDEMFEAIKEHLRRGVDADHIPVLMTVFRPQTPGTHDGPRIWNSQLMRYAGHREGVGHTVVGDPAEVNFTDTVKKYFNWSPRSGKNTMFDPLPIVVQIDPSTAPSVYELPEECWLEIPIRHPKIAGISQLGLKWYGIPAVSNITMDLGGLHYTAAPFNGWYMVTEIATRNFGDESRYNLLPDIAEAMGIDTSTHDTLWRDHALAAINYAVLHSFKRDRVSIADHHTCAEAFAKWYAEELKTRGYAPGNWKWIVPPTASSTSSIYLGLNKMTEYTIKPALVAGMSLNALVSRAKKTGFFTVHGLSQAAMHVAVAAAKFRKRMITVTGGVVLFASDGGRTQSRASWLWAFLRQRVPMIRPVNIATPDADFASLLQGVQFIMVLASTTGSGQVPNGSENFIEWTKTEEGRAICKDKRFAVCAFGSKAYPKFCAGGKQFASALASAGAAEMYPITCCDQLDGEDASMRKYTVCLFDWLLNEGRIPKSLRDLMVEHLDNGVKIEPSFALHVRQRDVHGRMTLVESQHGLHATLTDRAVLGNGARMNTVWLSFTLRHARGEVEYYKPGDHVAVWPQTNEALARYFAAHFGVSFEDDLELVPTSDAYLVKNSIDPSIPNRVNVGTLFTKILDISGEPSAAILSVLAHYVDDDECKSYIEELALDEDVRRDWLELTGARIYSLFDHFPTLSTMHRRDRSVGLDMLRHLLLKIPKLRPRYYSVSSSPKHAGNSVFSLTVGRLTYKSGAGSRMHLGFCSDFLATLPLGANVVVEMRPAPSFRMPRTPKVPILMIAGGTGIAPFKGFIEHRVEASLDELGEAWLIVGCRCRDNQLYAEEMNAAVLNGHLTRYLVGYSREPKEPKRYIDAVMREHAAEIRDLVARGCHVYVCGDVRIEISARNALVDILGESVVVELEKSRYHLDIFGAFDVQRQHQTRLESARKSLQLKRVDSASLNSP